MAVIPSAGAPVPLGVYTVTFTEIAGTVAALNYLSVFNPVNSGILHSALMLRQDTYATSASSTAISLVGYRTTSSSGGMLMTASTVTRYLTTMPDPVTTVRTGNPSFTALNNVPVLYHEPIISTGAGNSNGLGLQTPPGQLALIRPGEGLGLSTSAGNTNQVYNFTYTWAEYKI